MPGRKADAPARASANELQEENKDLRSRLRKIGELAASHDAEYEQDPQSRLDEILEVAEFEEEEDDLDEEDGEDDDDEEDDEDDEEEDDEDDE